MGVFRTSIWPLLVLAAVVGAGCSGPAAKPAEGPLVGEAAFDDLGLEATKTTGVVRGVVFDEAVRPLPGVLIVTTGAVAENITATSNEEGLFGFDGLESGTYFLQVAKVGYITTQLSVDVVAGVDEPEITKVLLQADPESRPRFEEYVYDAFIACSFTAPVVSVAACGLAASATNNRFLVDYKPDIAPTWIQTEAVWKSTNPFGGSLSLSITDFRGAQITVNRTDGKSPIYTTVNETRAIEAGYGDGNGITIRLFSTSADGTDPVDEQIVHDFWANNLYGPYNSTPVAGVARGLGASNPFGPTCLRYPVLFDACLRWGGVGVVINQQVNVYTHIFYGFTPEENWRFATHGSPSSPP